MHPSTAGHNWWQALDENEQGFFILGYITASWVWSRGIYEAQDFEELSPPIVHIYNLLAPVSTYTWEELTLVVSAYYRKHPDSETPIWEIIHSYATEPRDTIQGDI